MSLARHACLAASLSLFAQEPPPQDARPVQGEASLKAEVEALQKRLRQQVEDEVLRSAELRKALEEVTKGLATFREEVRKGQEERAKKQAELDGLPDQMKAASDQARQATERMAALEKRISGTFFARLEAERLACLTVMKQLSALQKEAAGLDSIQSMEAALGHLQEATRLHRQPEFKALIARFRDKLGKSPMASPLADEATLGATFGNPDLGTFWTLGALSLSGSWWGGDDKPTTLAKALPSVDLATRLEGELRAARLLIGELKLAALHHKAGLEDTLAQGARALNLAPEALASLEAVGPKSEALFKEALEPGGATLKPEGRQTLANLRALREETLTLTLERRLLLQRLAALAGHLHEGFGRHRTEGPAKGLPALEAFTKAAGEARATAKAALLHSAVDIKALGQTDLAGL